MKIEGGVDTYPKMRNFIDSTNGDSDHMNGNSEHISENSVRSNGNSDSDSGVNFVKNFHDQYADGTAARACQFFVGDKDSRTNEYRQFLVQLLRANNCHRILDVACGSGVDSVLLLEEGFEVVSLDASYQMLKYAEKERWARRNEPGFCNWKIEEGNWLTLQEDIKPFLNESQQLFDAIICLGNSYSHMLDTYGDQREQKLGLSNFEKCIRPGGLLLIDHRNFDQIIDTGVTRAKSLAHINSNLTIDIRTALFYNDNKANKVTLYYNIKSTNSNDVCEFNLSYYPHRLASFQQLLKEAFGQPSSITTLGDFKPISDNYTPSFYIHIIKK